MEIHQEDDDDDDDVDGDDDDGEDGDDDGEEGEVDVHRNGVRERTASSSHVSTSASPTHPFYTPLFVTVFLFYCFPRYLSVWSFCFCFPRYLSVL